MINGSCLWKGLQKESSDWWKVNEPSLAHSSLPQIAALSEWNQPPTNWFRLAELQNSSSGRRFVLLDFTTVRLRGFPGGSDGKESACNAGDPGSNPGLGRSPGEGNGNPLQYSCLENPTHRGAWRATVHGVAKSQTRQSDEYTQSDFTAESRLNGRGAALVPWKLKTQWLPYCKAA